MSLDVTGLSAFTNENLMPLIKKSVLEGRTAELISVQPGIKSSATINTLASSLVGQAGACGWNNSGSTVLGQETITVADIKINESICLNTLEDYYTQVMMRPGSYNEEIPFEQLFAEEKASKVSAMVDDIIWQGNTATGTGNLALADGLLKIVSGSVDTIVSAASGSITAANAIAAVDTIASEIPSDILGEDDLMVFMGYDAYRTYAKALRDANLFHYNGAEGQDYVMYIPGTNVRAIAVRGLNGTNKMVATSAKNLYMGTDLLNDTEDFKLWYSQDNDEVRFLAKFKLGAGVAFPGFVVYHN